MSLDKISRGGPEASSGEFITGGEAAAPQPAMSHLSGGSGENLQPLADGENGQSDVDRLLALSHAATRSAHSDGRAARSIRHDAKNLLVRGLGRDLPEEIDPSSSVVDPSEVEAWLKRKAAGAARFARRSYRTSKEVKPSISARNQSRHHRRKPPARVAIDRKSSPSEVEDAEAVLGTHSKEYKNMRAATDTDNRIIRLGKATSFVALSPKIIID